MFFPCLSFNVTEEIAFWPAGFFTTVTVLSLNAGYHFFHSLKSTTWFFTASWEALISTDFDTVTFEGKSKASKKITMKTPSRKIINLIKDILLPFKNFYGDCINYNAPKQQDSDFPSFVPKVIAFKSYITQGIVQVSERHDLSNPTQPFRKNVN